jgi:hypothetical protein
VGVRRSSMSSGLECNLAKLFYSLLCALLKPNENGPPSAISPPGSPRAENLPSRWMLSGEILCWYNYQIMKALFSIKIKP